MAQTETEMSLAEAVNIVKKLENTYRVFDQATDAAKTVLAAHNSVEAFNRDADKAKADLAKLKEEIAAAKEEKKNAETLAATAVRELKATTSERSKLEADLATFRPHYESEKARLSRDLEGLKAKLEQELSEARGKALAKIEGERAILVEHRDNLQAEVEQLLDRRDKLQGKIQNAEAAIGA